MTAQPAPEVTPPEDVISLAFAEAEAARVAGEVPVGAVVFRPELGRGWALLSRARNRIVELRDPTAHAELLAIRMACALEGSERLTGATLVTTLEPCVMCSGAILFARLDAVFYCAKTDSGIGLEDVLAWDPERLKGVNHTVCCHRLPECADRSAVLLREFFAARRDAGMRGRGNMT